VVFLFIAAYTGVLLAVSNQPIWSDTWALGGLFLASGLSGAAALLSLLVRYRPAAGASDDFLRAVDGYFALLEVLLLVAFFVTIGLAGTLVMALELPWVLLWVLVLRSLVPPLTHLVSGRMQLAGRATAALEATGVAVPALVLAGVIALRFAVIFSAQF
jgi:formate-dependent nitrite reductase membrane component NrfD